MIEFIEEGHLYLNSDGVIIPSVSQLIHRATGDDFGHIPKHILKSACDFGTDIHNAIERYFVGGVDTEFDEIYRSLAYGEFKRLYSDFIIDPICECLIDYNERYGGRIDCLNGDILIDYKTNSKINIPHLEWQMGFYKMALESKGIKVNQCKCLWLPKRKSGEWVDITPKPKEECLRVLEEFENEQKDSAKKEGLELYC